jgi:hypothetical protein
MFNIGSSLQAISSNFLKQLQPNQTLPFVSQAILFEALGS